MNWYKIIKLADKYLTQDEIYEILKLFGKHNMTVSEIAQKIGKSPTTINNALRLFLGRRSAVGTNKYNEEVVRKILELFGKYNMTVTQIAKKLSFTTGATNAILNQFLGSRSLEVKFSPEQEHQIIHLYVPKEKGGEDLFVNKIAEIFNVSPPTIRKVLVRHNIPLKTKEEAVSQSIKNRWKNPEYRENLSQKSKDRWKNPKYLEWGRQQMKNRADKIWQNQEFRKKIKQMMLKRWSDPEYQEKMKQVNIEKWERLGDFWNWLKKFPIKKRIEIVKAMWSHSKRTEKGLDVAVQALVQKAIDLGPPDLPVAQSVQTPITNPQVPQNTDTPI
jgi:predicted HTH domain antitoxin